MNGWKSLQFSYVELELMKKCQTAARKEALEALKNWKRAKQAAYEHPLPDRRLKAAKRLNDLYNHVIKCVWAYREARKEHLEIRDHRRAA